MEARALAYSYGFASLERVALGTATGSVILVGGLVIALACLGVYRRRLLTRRPGFVFDELPDPAVVTLGL